METLMAEMKNRNIAIDIRQATTADREAIVALDAEITGTEKPEYWTDILDRFAGRHQQVHSCFLVATSTDDKIVGFIVGEIRAWEFGSPPCGWVLVVGVTRKHRESGIGGLLLDALCAELKKAGVMTVRTMALRNDKANLSFFRGEGLAAGPYIELEKSLD
jgi:ribosomal protein S18 acetylase RimI-like enzyme